MSKRPTRRKSPQAGRNTTRRSGRTDGRAERLAALSALTRLITSATDSAAVFRGIAEAATALLKAKMAWVWVADAAGETLREGGSFGLPPSLAHLTAGLTSVPLGRGVVGAVFETRAPEFILDIQDDPRWLARPVAEAVDLHACAAVPLMKQDRAVGVLLVLFGRRPGFTAEERELVGLLADQAAIAIENARLLEEADRRHREAEAVAELAREINASLDLDTVLQRLVESARELTDGDMARIALRDAGSERFSFRHWVGACHPGWRTVTLEPGRGLSGQVLRTGRSVRTSNYLEDPQIPKDYARLAREEGVVAALAVPVKRDERVEALLFVLRQTPRAFTDRDEEVVLRLADHAAVAIQNARLYAEGAARRRSAEAVAELGRALLHTLDPKLVGQQTADSARTLLDATNSALYRLDETGALVSVAVSGNLGPSFGENVVFPPGTGAIGAAVRTGQPVTTPDVLADDRFILTPDLRLRIEPAGYRSVLSVPLFLKDRVIGALSVGDQLGRVFNEDEVRAMQTFAAQAALALENARLYAEAERRRREAEALARLSRTLTESLDTGALGDRLMENVLSLFKVHSACLRRLRPDGSTVLVAGSGKLREHVELEHVLPEGQGLAARAIAEGRPVGSPDLLNDDAVLLPEDLRPRLAAAGYRAVLAVPLRVKGAIIGTMLIADDSVRRFSEPEVELAQTVADHAAITLENARLYEETERRRREAEALAEISRALTQTLKLDVIAQTIADRAMTLLEVRTAVFFEILPGSGDLRVLAVVGALAPAFDRLVFPRASGLAGLAVRERRIVTSGDLLVDPRVTLPPEARARLEADGVPSGLSAPFIVGEEVIGVLSLGDTAGRVFSAADVRAVEALADQAALALQNARLYRDAERRRREAEINAELAQAIGASLDLDTVLQRITDGAKDLVGSDMAMIGFREGEEEAITIRYRVGSRYAPGRTLSIEPGKGLGGQVLLTGRPWRTHDYTADATFGKEYAGAVRKDGPVTAMVVPIKADERVVGVLYVCNRSRRPFTDRDETILLRLADSAAIAIKNAQLYARQRESERRYRSLFENATDPIATFALDGTITSVNPEAERLTGYTHEELLGRHFSDLARPDSAARLAERARRVLAGETVPPSVEVVVLRKDGGEAIVEGRFSPIRDDGQRLTGWQVIYRDMTERKRAEEALRASEERYRRLVEGSLQGVCIVRDWVTLFANTALATMLGYESPGELVGLDARCWIAPHEIARIEGYAAAQSRGEPAPTRYEFQALRKDGALIWAEVQVAEISWDGQPATQITGFDITESKQAEQALRQQEDQLRQAQKMEAVGRLAGGIAHDFNNLLTVITGRSDLLLRRLPAGDPVRRDVELIKRTGERAAVLTRQLLAFSRKQMLQPKVLDLNQVVASVAQMLQRLIGEDVDLVTALDRDLGLVTADPAQIEQIIMNLAVNARDAMPHGGRLRLETANVELDQAFVAVHPGASAGAHAMLAVGDTGTGMTPEVQAHIFEPFFTTKEVGKGTGLGLATVYGIVKQHDGYIAVESAPGAGTTLRVYLRRVQKPVERAEPGPAQPALSRASETVLLVEDEADLRTLAAEILEGAGYAVLAAGGPGEAMERARHHLGPIHLLLTDVVMPEMSGRDLAERLALAHPGMKVLYMSGYTADAIVHHGVLAPGIALLQKPFTPDALTRKVREVLMS